MSSAAPAPRAARLALVLLTAVAVAGCPDDSLDTTPPPAVDATGTWSGVWAEENDTPLFGDFVLTLLQQPSGQVTGTVGLAGIPCFANNQFQGQTDGLELNGVVEDEGLRVTFFVDLRGVEQEMPELEGSFTIEQGTDCVVTEAVFVADLQIGQPVPGALAVELDLEGGDESAPALALRRPIAVSRVATTDAPRAPETALLLAPWYELGGAWRGELADDSGTRPLELTLLQTPDGGARGLLALGEGEPLPFLGAVRGPVLAGVAEGAGLRLRLEAWPVAAAAGERQLEGALLLEQDGAESTAGAVLLAPLRVR